MYQNFQRESTNDLSHGALEDIYYNKTYVYLNAISFAILQTIHTVLLKSPSRHFLTNIN